MAFTDKLFSPFRKSNPPENQVTTTEATPVIQPESISLPALQLPSLDTSNALPDWLENEDLLRDEGVIFGLSESDAEEKTAIIRSFFAQQAAGIEQLMEQLNEKIGELNLWINQKEDLILQKETQIQQLKNQQFADFHHLPRTLAGFLLALGMCVGNYFLIEESLQGAFQNSRLVALGVFLAGMFNLFGKISFLHEDDPSKPVSAWKKLLEEIGMPLAAATLVFVMVLVKMPPVQAVALWVFVFFLFMFSGKLLLGNLTLLQRDLDVYSRHRQLRQDKIHKVQEWEDEIASHKKEIEQHRQEKQQILPQLTQLSTELNRIQARRDMLVKLFESEFYLARNLKKNLSAKQLSQIKGNL
ncbi:MAG: hypothetical protein U0Y10_09750 [Spirosomataceae bacterium]